MFLIDDLTECWIWQGSYNANGYPVDRGKLAYRRKWEVVNGPVPKGMHLHHTCEERGCINPEHLELKSASQHQSDHHKKRRVERTVCVNGHPWENLIEEKLPNGKIKLRCRMCRSETDRNRKFLRALRAG